MRIVVHDYSGHPFQVQLSRWLAGQGHAVLHLFSADIETPRGSLVTTSDDPPSLEIEPVSLGKTLQKYSLVQRYLQEKQFAVKLSRRVREFRPDVVISSNTPVDVQKRLLTDLKGVPFVFWVQDIYSIALRNYLSRKSRVLSAIATAWFSHIEFQTMRRSDKVVVITDDFRSILEGHGVDTHSIETVPNWAPLDELPQLPRDNDWAREHGFADKFVYLYSGTLGLKHDPGSLVELAQATADDENIAVVVISQGLGRKSLEEAKAEHGLKNLHLFDYQPFELLPQCLATADVQLVLLEPEASTLSVPSKVLTYLASGRPILGMMPPENLSSLLLTRSGAGIVVEPGRTDVFVEKARQLEDDASARLAMGASARTYAEETFDIDRIGTRFLAIMNAAGAPLQTT